MKKLVILAVAVGAAAFAAAAGSTTASDDGYEVWAVDQSNTTGTTGGGALYVYDGETLEGQDAASATPERIDLGGAVRDLCVAQTGAAPVRPHMILFNASQTHGVLSFVVSGHVVFIDAEARSPVACLRASVGAGGARQAHAAVPSADEKYVVVANQNGKLLERVRTDYTTNSFVWDGALDLAAGTTPSGAARQDPVLRPDNAPICPLVASDSRLTFVTLRGGGLFVVDTAASAMQIVAEYDRNTIHGNGCGGAETGGKMYVNSGGGTAANLNEFDVYSFTLSGFSTPSTVANSPAPALVVSQDEREHTDSHGTGLLKQGRYLWVTDRAGNRIVVIATATDTVVGEFSVVGPLSSDPSPDLLAPSPSGHRMYVALRGALPLSGDPHASTGSTPGVGVIRVEESGRRGTLQAIARISNMDGAVERADPHGIAVRRR